MIRPTNGRVVLFTPRPNDYQITQFDVKQPLTAHVAHVWGDRLINVTVIDSYGQHWPRANVVLLQDDEPKPEGVAFCTWMDYQKGQAAKAEAAEAALLAAQSAAKYDAARGPSDVHGNPITIEQMDAQMGYKAPASDPA